jgi:hypothetical protein
MSRGQRVTFLAIAVVIGIVAIFLLADSSEDDSERSQTAATATPTPTPEEAGEETATPTPTPTPTPEPVPPLLTSGKVTELDFTEGQTVRFRVRSDAADHVHVHGYDLMKDVEPGKTTTMSFKATITGIFEIELEDAGEEIGRLKVEPD